MGLDKLNGIARRNGERGIGYDAAVLVSSLNGHTGGPGASGQPGLLLVVYNRYC